MTQTLAQRPHSLYRFFDARGGLLYIGITASLPTRLASHNDEKPWWLDVADIKVEHFPNRESVLAAEKAAIIAERPIHNVIHNRRAATPRVHAPFPGDEMPGVPAWTFGNRRWAPYERTIPLWLYWEVHCDPVSDDWLVEDISAEELWRLWLTRYPRDDRAEEAYGPGAFRILWSVDGPGVAEYAPFQELDPELYDENFLTSYTWPVNPQTGEPLQWTRLPVVDKVWRRDRLPALRETKGGFIQEATGWKPAPLQPYVNIHQLARMAGLYAPEVCR